MTTHHLNHDFTWVDAGSAPRLLSAEQIESFDRDGYVALRGVLDRGEIAALQHAIDEHEARTEEFLRGLPDGELFIAKSDAITFTVHLVVRCAPARRFTRHPVMLDLAHDLVGPDVRLYWDQAVYKKPEPDREFPWHQDNGYAFIEPQQYLTCWVPLTAATLDNGCPWIAPRRHRSGTLTHRATPVGFQCLDQVDDAVPVEADPGDVVVFSSLTPHRTGPNRTDATRKAYIVQYAPDGATVVSDDGTRTPCVDPERQYEVLRGGSSA